MNRRDKLILTGVVALAGAFAVTRLLTSEPPPPAPPVVRHQPAPVDHARTVEMMPPEEVPEEALAGIEYLEKRWGHMGDKGLVLPNMSAAGARVYIAAEPKVGRNGRGEPVFLRSYTRAKVYEGEVFKPNNPGLSFNAKVTTTIEPRTVYPFNPGAKGSGKALPLEQVMKGDYASMKRKNKAGGDKDQGPQKGQ